MARKRKLMATVAEDESIEAPTPAMGGMWAGSAMNLLKQRIETTQGSLVQGILSGTVALELDPSQIVDESGSDRVGAWTEDAEFEALKSNIARRGQTQPVRVRPVDAAWEPDAEAPTQTDARFVVQSGRRRIEACRQLGRPVLAILSTDAGDAALADLEERFHENTMRKNLSGFEELLSIGLLADSLKDLTQEEIAARLAVTQNDVSLGRSCLELRDDIMSAVDVETTPKRAYRSLVPKLRRGGAEAARPTAPQTTSAKTGTISVDMKPAAKGVTIAVKGIPPEAGSNKQLALDLMTVLQKYVKRD